MIDTQNSFVALMFSAESISQYNGMGDRAERLPFRPELFLGFAEIDTIIVGGLWLTMLKYENGAS